MSPGALDQFHPRLAELIRENQVPEMGIDLLRHFGLTSMKAVKALGASSESVRECIVNGLGLDPSAGPWNQLALIKLLVVWDSARQIVLAESQAQAVAASIGRPVPLGGYEAKRLCIAFCATFRDEEFDRSTQPDQSYLGLIKTILRDREPRAEPLSLIHI